MSKTSLLEPEVEVKTEDEQPQAKVEIILPGHKQTITACAEVLYRRLAKTGQFLMRGGRVMMLDTTEDRPILRIINPDEFRSLVEPYFAIRAKQKGRNNKIVRADAIMSNDNAKALLAAKERCWLPNVRGLSGCPLLLLDDRIIGPGLDRESGILVTECETPPNVDLESANNAIEMLLSEFDFCTPGDKSRAVAWILTPALRLAGFITKCPIMVVEADKPQAGKGYLQEIIAAIYNETPNVVAKNNGGVGSAEEHLKECLVEGRPFIQFDNYRGLLDSQFIESFLTVSSPIKVRIVHRGYIKVDPRQFILMMTSNAAETTPDMAERSSIVRLRKRPYTYQFKAYPEGELIDHVRANQPYYLGCVFSILRLWIQNGRPRTDETRHSFRQWSQHLDWIVRYVCGEDELMAGHDEARLRLSQPNLVFVRQLAIHSLEGGAADYTTRELFEISERSDLTIPGLPRVGDEEQGTRCVGKIMKQVFGGKQQVEVDGIRIQLTKRKIKRTDGQGYNPAPAYRFERIQ